MTKYIRKTFDTWDVEVRVNGSGMGWECVNPCESRKEAKESLKEYQKHLSGSGEQYRWRKVRNKIEEVTA